MEKKIKKRTVFSHPWQYKEGFVISIILFIFGMIINLIIGGKPISVPSFPTNFSLIVTYTLLLIFVYYFEKNNPIVKWLSGIPAAITSTIMITVLAGILGFLPQIPMKPAHPNIFYVLGFTHLTTSWMFALGYLFFLTTLGLTTVKMFMPFRKKKLGTILSHLGLYIIIISAFAGDGDIIRAQTGLYLNKPATDTITDYNYAVNKKMYKTPFKLKLNKFDMKEYNPKIVLVESKTEELFDGNDKMPYYAEENTSGEFKNWRITTKKFFPYSLPADSLMSEFELKDLFPAIPSAYVEISDIKTNKQIIKGWITCGNPERFAKYTGLYRINIPNISKKEKYLRANGKSYFFAMLSPEPKEYSSDVTAIMPDGKNIDFTLKVNEPKKIAGWKIYQIGYNEDYGKWSNYSVLEVNRDPWLPVVYFGIFILMAGACYIFWLGRQFSKD